MPVGVSPRIQQDQIREYMPVDAYSVTQGQAVALVDDAGTMKLLPCSATTYAAAFVGFSDRTIVQGRIPLITNTGARVTPVVEGGVPLVPGNPVWLSTVAGQVTQTPPNTQGARILKVGVAVSLTTIVIVRDSPPQVG